MLNENIDSIYAMIDSLSEEELFKPHMRKWADEATKTAVWEVYKFIHVNTVAPFGTFRTKIQKINLSQPAESDYVPSVNGCLKIKAFLLKEFKRTTRMGAIHKMLITVNASVQIQPCFA